MIEFPSYKVYRFLSDYFLVYSVAVIGLFIAFLFSKNRRQNETYNLIYVFNTLVAWVTMANILLVFAELFTAWYGQNPYEWYAFRSGEPFSYVRFYTQMALFLFPGLLFFFRRLRVSWILTIIFMLLQISDTIQQVIFSLSADYLPSSWANYERELIKVHTINGAIILLLLLFTYWQSNRREKLPYPSLFLK